MTNDSLRKFLKDHNQINFKKLTQPLLIAKVYPILVEKNLIQPTGMHYLLDAVNQLVDDAIIADNNFEEANNHGSDHENNDSSDNSISSNDSVGSYESEDE